MIAILRRRRDNARDTRKLRRLIRDAPTQSTRNDLLAIAARGDTTHR